MQRLILMRHADAERAAPSGRDRDRALSERGRDEALRVGQALAARGLRPDTALISPATRTRQTWALVHEALGDVEAHEDEALYNADADVIRRAVEAREDQAGCLIVIVHNPGVHHLAVEYLTEAAASPAISDRVASGFPTAAAAVFGVDVAGRPVFEGFLQPSDLAR